MSDMKTPSWEGEPVDLSELGKPENRGPGYDTPLARSLRGENGVVNTPPRHRPHIVVVADNEK